MIRSGRVVRCDNGFAVVELDAQSACGNCSSGGCSAILLPGLNPRIRVPVETHYTPGERLSIQAPEPGNAWLCLMLIAYGLPILGLFIGVLGAAFIGWAESLSVVSGVLGFVGGLIAWHLLGKTNWWSSRLSPPLSSIRIVQNDHEKPLLGPLR